MCTRVCVCVLAFFKQSLVSSQSLRCRRKHPHTTQTAARKKNCHHVNCSAGCRCQPPLRSEVEAVNHPIGSNCYCHCQPRAHAVGRSLHRLSTNCCQVLSFCQLTHSARPPFWHESQCMFDKLHHPHCRHHRFAQSDDCVRFCESVSHGSASPLVQMHRNIEQDPARSTLMSDCYRSAP